MHVRLEITAGPHAGKEFSFDRHDTFLVGRTTDAHLQLSYDDPYFSRRHFFVEVNPPRCRVVDLNSRNGIYLNGKRIDTAELKNGDEIRAGHTVFRVVVPPVDPNQQQTIDLPVHESPEWVPTIDHASPPDGLVPGYELQAELGRGAMGVVHRAVRRADGTPVAVKLITPAAGVGNRQVEKFVREARMMSELNHPNVAAYCDSGRAEHVAYLVMELVDGPDAGRILKAKGPLSVANAVRITCNLLSGLAHAHAKGIIHRDVKPSNLLIGGPAGKRVVKVADFGMARAYDECKLSGLTMQGEVGGTPAFMAPEQVTHFRHVKPAADQYAAGATLYNLLTDRYPHDLPKDVGRRLVHIITESVVPVRTRRADLPAALAEAIHRALGREPGDRFPDVTAFRSALLPFTK